MKPEELKLMSEGDGMACMAKAELREVLVGIERLESFKQAYMEWSDKTEWVQDSVESGELGKHRADAIRIRFEQLKAENESLRKDAERYRWIKKESNLSDYEDCYSLPMVHAWEYKPGPELNEQFPSLDEAIDHAISSPENP